MDSAWETLEDVRQSLGDILAADHDDRETLEAAQERLDQLYRLKQKYGGSLEEVLTYRDKAQAEYEGLLSLESTLARLRKQEAILKAEMQTEADKLTAARKKPPDCWWKPCCPTSGIWPCPKAGWTSSLPGCRNAMAEARTISSSCFPPMRGWI